MKNEDVFLLRQVRQKIVVICREVCRQNMKLADREWEEVEPELLWIALRDEMHRELLKECRARIAKKELSAPAGIADV